ncbi:hypothetical protein F2Q69_00025550, partial [Brassica cretica]
SRGQHDEGNMSRPSWKRERSNHLINLSPNQDEELANCLVLLSNSGDHYNSGGHHNKHGHGKGQALGGHKRCHWLTPSTYFLMTPLHDSSFAARSQMLEQPSLDLNLACQEYSVDPTVMRVGSDDGGNNHNATSPDSWLKLARGDWS